MTGRERILAALSEDGTTATPMILCYPDIFLRDHWEQVTDEPWWSGYRGDIEAGLRVLRDLRAVTGEDRVRLRLGTARADRGRYEVRVDGENVTLVDTQTGGEKALHRPTSEAAADHLLRVGVNRTASSREEIDRLLSLGPVPTPDEVAADGRDELPRRVVSELGRDAMPWVQLPCPLNPLPFCMGFESFMVACAQTPELLHYAAEQILAHTLRRLHLWQSVGCELIWIEDCLTDQMSPASYERLVLPHLHDLTTAIRQAGMCSIHYYCGEPADRLEHLLRSGADALSLEESKKTFTIDIMQLAQAVQGRIALVGNIDAWRIMERGTMAQIRAEVARQLEAGRRNGGRFLMGYGSPITPGTPAARCRAVADMVRDMTS